MKREILSKTTILVILLFFTVKGFPDTLTVDISGGGQYTQIQNAIANANNGDVIIVFPGIYNEGLHMNGIQNLTLGSLYLINPQDSLIRQTIIDGTGAGSCVKAIYAEENFEINGFTLQNGTGTTALSGFRRQGGGIALKNASVKIKNCIIKNNSANGGGGIFANKSSLFVSNCKIIHNQSYSVGGGMYILNSAIEFDSINLCNIYLNYATAGTDFFQGVDDSIANHIIVDTATILHPDHYFFLSIEEGFSGINLTWQVNHGKIEAINADLYVNPEGDNQNSGITPEEPLQSLSFAMLKVRSDSTQYNTVHLANGTYSSKTTGDKFPTVVKGHVPIVGENMESTILDAEDQTTFSNCMYNTGGEHITIRNLSMINGNGDSLNNYHSSFKCANCSKLIIDSVKWYNCRGKHSGSLSVAAIDSVFISNSSFIKNYGWDAVSATTGILFFDTVYIEFISCVFKDNRPLMSQYPDCVALQFLGRMDIDNSLIVNLINCEIVDNNDSTTNPIYPGVAGIAVSRNVSMTLTNCTIGNNYTTNTVGAGFFIGKKSEVFVYNSIFYGNTPYQVMISADNQANSSDLSIFNSLLQNGTDGITFLSPYYQLYYDSSNIDADPMWIMTGDFPYSLSLNSPCIDSGTQNLPEGIVLPMVDLAGNPRISGSEIDMGAYEHLFVGMHENLMKDIDAIPIQCFPNPFNSHTKITIEIPENGHVMLNLYDINGNLLSTLTDGQKPTGEVSFVWYGTDDTGTPLNAGIYFLRLIINSKIYASGKLIKTND